MENKYDDLMIESLRKLKDLEFSHNYENEKLDYEFSKEYIKHKEKLIKSVGRPYWKFINTATKKVAIIIVALIIAFSSLMTVDAFRENVINFIYEIYNTFTSIQGKLIDEKNLNKNYILANIPLNFKNIIFNKTESSNSFAWINSQDKMIIFSQVPLTEIQQFNTEFGTLTETIINNTPCLTCKTNTDYFCYWEFDGYRFELIYPLDLGEEFMSEVVGNLVEIDTDELGN